MSNTLKELILNSLNITYLDFVHYRNNWMKLRKGGELKLNELKCEFRAWKMLFLLLCLLNWC